MSAIARPREPATHLDALRTALAIVFLGAVPAAAAVYMLVVAHTTHSIAADFHHELYPQAKLMLDGVNPYPVDAGIRGVGNLVWPPLTAFAVSPLTLLSSSVAGVVMVLAGLLCFAASLSVVGVRDWRVYGATGLWAPVLADVRVAHLTPMICLLLAVAWRCRDRRWAQGLAVGTAVALKFFVWPLVLWLACRRRLHAAALAVAIPAASLVLVLPFTGIMEYVDVVNRVAHAFDQDTYTPFGLLVGAGMGDTEARAVGIAVGLAVLGIAWRRQSFALFVAAALLLSPIVWLDYYALLIVPLAAARPVFHPIWLLPALTWGLPSAGYGIRNEAQVIWVLALFTVIVVAITRMERPASDRPARRGSRLKSSPV